MIKLQPRKSLGQHFLHQKSVIDSILDAFDPGSHQTVVEIGPGQGALTFPLAPRVGALHVVELDQRLVGFLSAQAHRFPNLIVHQADALRFDYCSVLTAGTTRVRVIGNLPYNISTALIFRLLSYRACIEDMCLMVQKEVAQRIKASPGNKSYGRLSVMVQHQCLVHSLISVAPGAFLPPPKVDSSVITLRPHRHPPYPVSNPNRFAQIVRAAFGQRRKTLKNALAGVVDEARIRSAGVDPRLRAEQLTVAEYARLSF